MNNRDISAGWRYHEGTKHPYGFLMNSWHRFNPADQPLSIKKYLDVESIPLPLGDDQAGLPALAAISTSAIDPDQAGALDIGVLARLLYYSAGITKRIRYPWGEFLFRAAACTGALYHIELYVVCGERPGLAAGVYHFDPQAMALDILREGDYRPALVKASGREEAVARAPAVIIYSDVFWRNACKYQAREYRHTFWDSGTILAHTLAMAAAYRLPARVVLGFADHEVDRLLGLDGRREASLGLLPVGAGREIQSEAASAVEELAFQTMPVSRFEIDFPAIQEMHQASSLHDSEQVAEWRKGTFHPILESPSGDLSSLVPHTEDELPPDALEEVIIRRGSSRRFARQAISLHQLSTILTSSTGGLQTDYDPAGEGRLNQLYLIIQAVDGLHPGVYVFHRDRAALELLKAGDFRNIAGHLGLGQALPADASVNIYFLADLHKIFDTYGNRGYRAAQLEASVTAGKMYLAAYALRIGATGLTFYDDEVVNFFSPHAKEKSVMFLIALGIPSRRR